ncbi:MAG: ribonuclease R family protein [Campylobacterota bacterium]|nr:ribonuclease R family protein [Campylobacterota bacterium]
MKEKYLKTIYDNQTDKIVKIVDEKYLLNSKYKIGKIILSNKIALFQDLTTSKQDIIIEFNKLNGAYSNDVVLVQVIFNPKGKIKAKVISILDRAVTKILCIVKNKELHTIKENIFIDCDLVNNQDGDVVIFQDGKIIQKFGNITNPKLDEQISLYLYNEFYRLDKDIDLPFNTPDLSNRIDLTHLDFSTIDPASAKDHDDAIYYDSQTKELYVAIADVSAYVKEDSELDKLAFKKSFSIYLPNKVLPMLPFELSTDLCSLVPNQKRLAYVFKMRLDTKKATVISSEVFEAIIESKNKYSYEYIDDVLKKDDKSNPNNVLYEVTKKFRKKRLQNGYDFRSDEIRLILDNEENLKGFNVEHSSPSHSLVEECMLLANQEAAKKLELLGIYRVHDEPSSAKIKKLIDDVNLLGINAQLKKDVHTTIVSIQQKAKNSGMENEIDELIIQSQQQAKYSNIKQQHFGLGFKDYSHFTSPIRRYADLVLHRILKTKTVRKDIETVCEEISIKEREIALLVWDYEDRKYARWASKNIGTTVEAKIVDIVNHTVKLEDKAKGARVTIENYSGEKLFSIISVKIVSSDIVSKKIVAKVIY